ncbi:MAG: hypothetical protein C4304_06515 [candidate division GAL15 bacterium]
MVEPVRAYVLVLAAILAGAVPARAQPAPLVVEADRITYDTVARTVEAAGRVRLRYGDVQASADYLFADLAARKFLLRGDVRFRRGDQSMAASEVRYRADTDRVLATEVRTLAEAAFLRAREVDAGRQGAVALDAAATLCDPANPLFFVTARRLVVFWADRLVAEDATLWIGGRPVLALPRYEIRVDPERAQRQFPSPEAGYDGLSGYWLALRYPFRLGDVEAEAYGRYNTLLGLEFRGRLRAELGRGVAELTAGVVRDSGARLVDTLELRYTPSAWPVAAGASFSASLAVGQYRERATSAESPRAEATLALAVPPVGLGGPYFASGAVSLRYAVYGQGTLAVPGAVVSLEFRPDLASAAYVSYAWTEAYGATPFLFDAPTRQSAVTVGYRQGWEGLSFDVGAQYDAIPQQWRVLALLQVAPADGWRVGALAKYNVTTASFEELELRAGRRCDCLDVSAAWRIPQRQLWLNLQLVPSPRVREAVPGLQP